MSQEKTVVLVDDLDSTIEEGVKKRKFALDGVTYEIDLGNENYERLCEVFVPLIENGRRVPRKRANTSVSKLARTKK